MTIYEALREKLGREPTRAELRDMFRGALERIERITWREGNGASDACRALQAIRREVTGILDAEVPEQPSIKQMLEK